MEDRAKRVAEYMRYTADGFDISPSEELRLRFLAAMLDSDKTFELVNAIRSSEVLTVYRTMMDVTYMDDVRDIINAIVELSGDADITSTSFRGSHKAIVQISMCVGNIGFVFTPTQCVISDESHCAYTVEGESEYFVQADMALCESDSECYFDVLREVYDEKRA